MNAFIVAIIATNLLAAISITPDFHDIGGWLIATMLSISAYMQERKA